MTPRSSVRPFDGGDHGGQGPACARALPLLGDSFLAYLSLMLTVPFVAYATFKPFLSGRAALALTLIFAAVPMRALFGSARAMGARPPRPLSGRCGRGLTVNAARS
jgi:hypothetical protein